MSSLLANGNKTSTTSLIGLLNAGEVTFTCSAQTLTRLVRGQIAKGTVVGIGNRVSSDPGIAFKELNHLLQHGIHLALIAVDGAGALVVDAGEFGDPHGFAVLGEMIEDAFDSVHVVLEDVDGDDFRWVLIALRKGASQVSSFCMAILGEMSLAPA